MNFNKEDVYYKMYYELYKAKDSYGVDVLTEIYNYLTKVIEKKLKKTNIMTNQDAKWYKNCNLAIYKECFGITPLGKFSDMETADQKQIPIDKYLGAFYYGYIFIVPKENIEKNISSPYSGDYKKYDKFMLTIRNGDFVLEKFNEENISGDKMVENEKKKLLEKENTELLEKRDKLVSDIENEKELNAKNKLKEKSKELKEKTNELNKLKEKTKELKQEESAENKKKLRKIETDINKFKKEIEKLKEKKETEEANNKNNEINKLNKLIDENQKKIKDNPSGGGNTGGFLIEEKDIGGKIYLTFSVSEYLDKMAKPTKEKKKDEAAKKVPTTVIKIVQQPTSVTTLTKFYSN